jgi:glucan phosphoethanolaminetransferase (alkaline phosphatase superfamily)
MKTEPPKGKSLAVIGACLQVAPILYLLISVAVLSQSGGNELGNLLRFGIITMAMSLSGAIMLFISLVFMKYRALWFFRFMAIFSIYLVFKMSLFFTPLGIITALYLLSKRSEFTTARTNSPLQAGAST